MQTQHDTPNRGNSELTMIFQTEYTNVLQKNITQSIPMRIFINFLQSTEKVHLVVF